MRTYGTASKVLFLLYISRSRYWLYSGIDFCIWNYAQIMPLHLLLYWSTTHDVYFNFTKVTLIDSFCYSIKINSPFLLHYRILIYQCFCSGRNGQNIWYQYANWNGILLFHLKYNFDLFWFVSGITGHFVKFQSKSKIWLVQMHDVVFRLLRKKFCTA